MASQFQLSTELKGHETQVRSVGLYPVVENGIITCSLDKMAKVWGPTKRTKNDEPITYEVISTLIGHEGFVVDVISLPTSDEYPAGLVVTASLDKTIRFWDVANGIEVKKIELPGSVSCLNLSPNKTLIAGSWDKTARVYSLSGEQLLELKGHTQNVLCVLGLKNGCIATGGGDDTIRFWDQTGSCLKVIQKAHSSPVRSLVEMEGLGIISVGNDGDLKLWSLDGEKLQETHAHANLIYSVIILKTGEIVTASEDKTVKVWKDGTCVQVIEHPACVWKVVELPNGDIASACADGVCRVFTRDKDRVAPEELIKQFQDAVQNAKKKVGGIDVTKLPTPEVLKQPGKKDGDTKLVNNNSVPEVYQWNESERKWIKIGDMVDAPEGQQIQGNIVKGKRYDRVFDIEVNDGRKLKCGYNKGENPYTAAQRFIWDNDVPQYFLDEIARFIADNVPEEDFVIEPATDPFTGGRYVPQSRGKTPQQFTGPIDPFTGGNAYRPSSYKPFAKPSEDVAFSAYAKELQETKMQKEKQHFPADYEFFKAANYKGIRNKIIEFNNEVAKIAPGLAMNDSELQIFNDMMTTLQSNDSNAQFKSDNHYELLTNKLLKWPTKMVFPFIDVTRLLFLNNSAAEHFANDKDFIPNLLALCFNKDLTYDALQMLCLRAIANGFFHQNLKYNIVKNGQTLILEVTAKCPESKNKTLRDTYAVVLHNFSVHLSKIVHDDPLKLPLLNALQTHLSKESDEEIVYRLLVAVGTLIKNNTELKNKAKTEFKFQKIAENKVFAKTIKTSACAEQLKKLFDA